MAFTRELEHEDGRGHLEKERGIFIVVGARAARGRVLLRSREGPLPP
jgi:hypothetical protein